MKVYLASTLLALAASGMAAAAPLQTLPEILNPPGTSVQNLHLQDLHLSDDGTAIAGLRTETGNHLPFLWTAEGGTLFLDHPGSIDATLAGLSGDGMVIAGNVAPRLAVIWDATGAATRLGSLTLNPLRVTATAMSRDGTVVVGFEQAASGVFMSFIWTAASGMQELAGSAFRPKFISDDGTWIAGQAGNKTRHWSANTGVFQLPVNMEVTGMSGDGQVVVGIDGVSAYFWTQATGAISPGGFCCLLNGGPFVSADGSAMTWWSSHTSDQGFWHDLATGTTVQFTGPEPEVLSADGRMIIASVFSGDPYVWQQSGFVQRFESFSGDARVAAASRDGRYSVGVINNLTIGQDTWPTAMVRWNLDGEIGGPYCGPSVPNSTGEGARLRATGINLVASNNVTLQAESLPAFTFGFFLSSLEQDDVFPVALSQGRLCLGGAIGSFVGPQQIKNSGPDGAFELALPLNGIATPSGPIPVAPGDTWNFQCWYRDAIPASTSNFTNGLRLTFQ